MSTLQKVIIGGLLAVLVLISAIQLRQSSRLRGQIEILQLQQASLTNQIEQLKKEPGETSRTVAANRAAPERITRSESRNQSLTPNPLAPAPRHSETLERDLAAAYAEPTAGRREMALKKFAQNISPDDVPRALAILAKAPDMNGVQSPLFAELSAKWGHDDSSAAADWANTLTNADARKEALVGVMKGWTGKDPDAAVTYAASLTPADVQEAAVMKVIGEWTFWGGADGAARWVGQLPPGNLRDKAMGPILFWGTGQCPASIADMLDATGDPEMVRKYGETVATVWLDRDPPAARNWIERSPLPDDVKSRLLKSKE